ncbi:hypothetical protein AMAG_18003 [Allomyces macrogynus ATCC 38327]|uniref:SAM domain-containing protein n=1 Tax=Allomyces macrogynus (strain ATCC 38327) TaxID=578462 RepID=A0A0L0S3V9_ALLM3|nr:hypothetical protein AMAG_18003 [Allomyces macrogynus ATCC 38327]|eukprot:KNE57090.1 hypothetical protein AMAG_18003 [Allomyces macrogynus ATCC 38327]
MVPPIAASAVALARGARDAAVHAIMARTGTNVYVTRAQRVAITGPDARAVTAARTQWAAAVASAVRTHVAVTVPVPARRLAWIQVHRAAAVEKVCWEHGTWLAMPELGSAEGGPAVAVAVLGTAAMAIRRTIHALTRLLGTVAEATVQVQLGHRMGGAAAADADLGVLRTTLEQVAETNQVDGTLLIGGAAAAAATGGSGTGAAAAAAHYGLAVIELLGPAEQVAPACTAIAASWPGDTVVAQAVVRIDVGREYREFLAGKKQGKMNKIMRTTGARIQFEPAINPYAMTIAVASPEVDRAVDAYLLVADELPAELSFYVPEYLHKRIIGTGGRTIQRIMRQFGVFVKFVSASEQHAARAAEHARVAMLAANAENADPYLAAGAAAALADVEDVVLAMTDDAHNVIARTPAKAAFNLGPLRDAILDVAKHEQVLEHQHQHMAHRRAVMLGMVPNAAVPPPPPPPIVPATAVVTCAPYLHRWVEPVAATLAVGAADVHVRFPPRVDASDRVVMEGTGPAAVHAVARRVAEWVPVAVRVPMGGSWCRELADAGSESDEACAAWVRESVAAAVVRELGPHVAVEYVVLPRLNDEGADADEGYWIVTCPRRDAPVLVPQALAVIVRVVEDRLGADATKGMVLDGLAELLADVARVADEDVHVVVEHEPSVQAPVVQNMYQHHQQQQFSEYPQQFSHQALQQQFPQQFQAQQQFQVQQQFQAQAQHHHQQQQQLHAQQQQQQQYQAYLAAEHDEQLRYAAELAGYAATSPDPPPSTVAFPTPISSLPSSALTTPRARHLGGSSPVGPSSTPYQAVSPTLAGWLSPHVGTPPLSTGTMSPMRAHVDSPLAHPAPIQAPSRTHTPLASLASPGLLAHPFDFQSLVQALPTTTAAPLPPAIGSAASPPPPPPAIGVTASPPPPLAPLSTSAAAYHPLQSPHLGMGMYASLGDPLSPSLTVASGPPSQLSRSTSNGSTASYRSSATARSPLLAAAASPSMAPPATIRSYMLPPEAAAAVVSAADPIAALCAQLKLEDRYLNLFRHEEIDLTVLLSLTEDDFAQLGIKAYGPRRLLLLAIKDLQLYVASLHAAKSASTAAAPLITLNPTPTLAPAAVAAAAAAKDRTASSVSATSAPGRAHHAPVTSAS